MSGRAGIVNPVDYLSFGGKGHARYTFRPDCQAERYRTEAKDGVYRLEVAYH